MSRNLITSLFQAQFLKKVCSVKPFHPYHNLIGYDSLVRTILTSFVQEYCTNISHTNSISSKKHRNEFNDPDEFGSLANLQEKHILKHIETTRRLERRYARLRWKRSEHQEGNADESDQDDSSYFQGDENTDSMTQELETNWPEKKRLQSYNPRFPQKFFADRIKKLEKEKDIKSAIKVLEFEMLEMYRIRPTYEVFLALISALGRVGYVDKAFEMFRKMRKFQCSPTPHVFTSLFNACANSPCSEKELDRINELREYMDSKGYDPTHIVYNALIKAYGKAGALKEAFCVANAMVKKDIPLQNDTISVLLMACCSDKFAGFKRAVEVWHLMVRRKDKRKNYDLAPSLHHFNLLLRAVRDCGIGSPSEFSIFSSKSLAKNPKLLIEEKTGFIHPQLTSHNSEKRENSKESTMQNATSPDISNSRSEAVVKTESNYSVSDLMSPVNILLPWRKIPVEIHINCNKLNRPCEKIMLIGGTKDILNQMESCKLSPDLKTLTLLVQISDSTQSPRLWNLFLPYLKTGTSSKNRKSPIKIDADYINSFMRMAAYNRNFDMVRSYLSKFSDFCLKPNVRTMAILALGCRTLKDCLDLMKSAKSLNIELNEVVYSSMLRGLYDYNAKLKIIKTMLSSGIFPNKHFMSLIRKDIQVTEQKLLSSELKFEASQEHSESTFASTKHSNESNYHLSVQQQKAFFKFRHFFEHYEKTGKVVDIDPLSKFKYDRSEDLKIVGEEIWPRKTSPN